MLVGLNTFPLGAHLKKTCAICSDYGYDYCEGTLKPAIQQGEMVVTAAVGSVIEIYNGEDAYDVQCSSGCSNILGSVQCNTAAGIGPKYSLVIRNGNVYATLKAGRAETIFFINAIVQREYSQPTKLVSIRVTIR